MYSLAVAGTTIGMGIVINDSVLQHTSIKYLIGCQLPTCVTQESICHVPSLQRTWSKVTFSHAPSVQCHTKPVKSMLVVSSLIKYLGSYLRVGWVVHRSCAISLAIVSLLNTPAMETYLGTFST